MSDLAAAQQKVDDAWGAQETVRGPLRDQLRDLLASVEGVTGLAPGPGADNLINRFLDFAEFHADELHQAAAHRADAMLAESDRNDLQATLPAPEPIIDTPHLVKSDLSETRRWLMSANDADVRDALNQILDRDEQVEWAHRLLGWARQDGNIAQVFEAINSVIVPSRAATLGPPQQDPVTASATDQPVGRDDASTKPPEGGATEIGAWVGNDPVRARVAYDLEVERPEPRADVLALLVDVLDAHKTVTPEATAASAAVNDAAAGTPADPSSGAPAPADATPAPDVPPAAAPADAQPPA